MKPEEWKSGGVLRAFAAAALVLVFVCLLHWTVERSSPAPIVHVVNESVQTRAVQSRAPQLPRAMASTLPSIAFKVPNARWKARGAGVERVTVLVQLSDAAALDVHLEARRKAGGNASAAQAAVLAQLRTIGAAQDAFVAGLNAAALDATIVYRVKRVLNAVAVNVPTDQVAALRRMAGVRSVREVRPEFPTGDATRVGAAESPADSISVPFLGTPQVWASLGALGTGVKVGIIDTGLDYQHPNFGGSGLLSDYQANNVTQAPNAFFPSAKVAGGVDFAGDAYDGTNSPVPDPNPMDRNGHGTHVAGILAGYGVKPDGTTYTGPYTPEAAALFQTSLRIGPGMAPGATLYPIRVFGTTGSTSLTVAGIDWAIDPNGDGDFSDHMDVVNLSLGSSYGSLAETSSIAAESAARLGIVMCIAAGNDGDTYFIIGAPGVADSAITVACSIDTRKAAAVLRVNAPASIAGNLAAAPAAFGGGAPAPAGQTGSVVITDPTIANTALNNAAAVNQHIALIDRGTNNLQNKVANAQAAGAIAAIVVNNVPDDPALITMGPASGEMPITIPAVFISKADGDALKAALANGDVSVTLLAANSADTLSSFSSRGPQSTSGTGSPLHLKPDIAAPGQSIVSSQTGIVGTTGSIVTNPSGFIPGGQALTLSGTSMATPCVAGMMALLKQLHPGWSVEELKALALNNALHDLTVGANGSGVQYGPGRVGAGRADAALAATNDVIVFNADEAGAVSVSFGALDVVGSLTATKHVRVENRGNASATYALGFTMTTVVPGVTLSTPAGSSVTVAAHSSAVVDVRLDAVATQMQHTRDATVAGSQVSAAPLDAFGNVERHWVSEHAGYLTFSANGQTRMRVPVYAAPRPASAMAGPSVINTSSGATGTVSLPLSGTEVNTGPAFPTDVRSLVSPFELQVVHPLNPTTSPLEANIKYAGVAYDPVNDLILFGIVTHGAWNSPTDTGVQIFIDTDGDGAFDHVLFDGNLGSIALNVFGTRTSGTDVFIDGVIDSASNVNIGGPGAFVNANPGAIDTELMNSNVRILAASPAQLGLAAGVTKFAYAIATGPGDQPISEVINNFDYDEALGPFTWDYAAQGLNFGGALFVDDLNGSSIPVTYNLANLSANGSLGALLLHHHNAAGARAQVIPVSGTATGTDIAVTQSASTRTPALGQRTTLTITASNLSATAATGVVLLVTQSTNLNYVADDGLTTYDSSTGIWKVGALAAGATATLHLTVTPANEDPAVSVAALAEVTPLDVNAFNDRASVTLTPARQADLSLIATVSAPKALVGAPLTYTFALSNAGPSIAYAVSTVVQLNARANMPPASVVVSAGSYDAATGVWSLEQLNLDDAPTLTLTVNAPNTSGGVTATGTVSATTVDLNLANNTASATATILSPALIAASETVTGPFAPGSTVAYTVVLSNSSAYAQQPNPNDTFTQWLPAQLALVSATATSGNTALLGKNGVTWTGGIPAHGSVTITILATVLPGSEGTVVSVQGIDTYDSVGDGSVNATVLTDDPTLPGPSDPTTFTVPTPPVLIISGPSAVPNPAIVDLPVLFNATTQPADADVLWDFGDGTLGRGAAVSHIYLTEGTFTASATATTRFGTATAALDVVVGHATVLPGTTPLLSAHGVVKLGKLPETVLVVAALPVAAGSTLTKATLQGTVLNVAVGGFDAAFILDKRGNATAPDGAVRVRLKGGKVSAIDLTLTLKGVLKSRLSTGAAADANGFPLRLPIRFQLGATAYSVVVPLTFRTSATGGSARFTVK